MAPSYRTQAQDSSLVLFWVATALLGIYAVTVLAAAIPLELLQPAWIERVCGSVRGGVSFPLLAVALLLLAAIVNDSPEEPRYLTVIRRLACLIAFGFCLMIPLQTWAGVALLQQINANEQAQLRPYTRALTAIRNADSQDALLQALASIPGSPSNLSGSLKDPLHQVREQLIRQIEPQVSARQTQLGALQSSRLQEGFLRWFKDAVVAFFSAIGFAAIGRFAEDRPTLLSTIIDRRPPIQPLQPSVSLTDRLAAILPRRQPQPLRQPTVPLTARLSDQLTGLFRRSQSQRPRRPEVSVADRLTALLTRRQPQKRQLQNRLEDLMPPDPNDD